ncbi:uncharacterized protein K441DRAFT_683854 [Cenococcum geophilum 1.58]|uniref:uncharacterized protein n=1 Tax=Cenococcum geophilum 1.58 TaxID=794803 RepID=UPI00358E9E95|nr:hypothetical protein K441DRAFT_683854 [Cenococcum geophilum 1.58]
MRFFQHRSERGKERLPSRENSFLRFRTPQNLTVTPEPRRRGWVSQPDGRGTIDILSTCLLTIFLCTWTAIHLNVPGPTDTHWVIVRRKFRWMIQTILGPELVLGFATGQRAEAKRSLDILHGLGYTNWTIRHAFFANMGGFVLVSPDLPNFPINCKHLCYLATHGYISLPDIEVEDVWDKSKAAGFAKVITCLQVLWLAIQVIGRAVQHLDITTLEITTLSFVICTWCSQLPATPIQVHTTFRIAEILRRAGDSAKTPYRQTPLDFIDDLSPSWLIDLQSHLGFSTWSRKRPLRRFNNDRFPVVGASPSSIALFVVNMIYAAIHVVAWKFDFPTYLEMWLWRSASVTVIVTTFTFWMCESYQDGVRLGRWERWYRILRKKGDVEANRDGPKIPFIPTWEIVIVTPVAVLYTLSRTYLVVECFVSLRSLPSGAFKSVEWSELVPHF